MPIAHYIWIGPPPVKHIGCDIIGPILLKRKCPLQRIMFWCLNQHIEHYQTIFQDLGVDICSIESYLKRKIDTRSADALRLITKMLKYTEDNSDMINSDKNRFFTIIKEIIQYYLQIENHGYFLDTNILPSDTKDQNPLRELTQFSISTVLINFESEDDPWLMFSPESDDEAINRFHRYFDPINTHIEKLLANHDRRVDRAFVSRLFVETASLYCKQRNRLYAGEVDRNKSSFHIRALSLQKYYNNSHTLHESISPPFPYWLASTNNQSALQCILELGFDVNTLFSYKEDGSSRTPSEITIPFLLLYYNDILSLPLLLPHIIDLEAKIDHPEEQGRKVTLHELASSYAEVYGPNGIACINAEAQRRSANTPTLTSTPATDLVESISSSGESTSSASPNMSEDDASAKIHKEKRNKRKNEPYSIIQHSLTATPTEVQKKHKPASFFT